MNEPIFAESKDTKLEEIDRKLNMLYEEMLWLQRRLDDKKLDDLEKELKDDEKELQYKREELVAQRLLDRNLYDEKMKVFKKGY